MSYPNNLDEIPEIQLRAEIERRRTAHFAGVCDYCGRDPNTPTCKFPRRHRQSSRPVKVPQDKKDPFYRLVQWLSKRPVVLFYLAEQLGLPLVQCEGHNGPCTNDVLYETPGMTAYEWDGKGEDPNRKRLLCPECSAEYVEYWKAMWDEYHSGLL